MKKRFTDTEKWNQPWFRQLAPAGKLLWVYLLDRCDPAGVWEKDAGAFCFFSGVTEAQFAEALDHLCRLGKVSLLCSQETDPALHPDAETVLLWVGRFVQFQYGILSHTCPPHKGVFAALAKHGLEQDSQGVVTHTKGTPKGKQRVTVTPKEKEGEKEKEKEVELVALCVAHWNETVGHLLPVVRRATPARARAIESRLAEGNDVWWGKNEPPLQRWKQVVAKVEASPFLQGQSQHITGGRSGWKANLDWLLKPANWEKVMDGNYDPPKGQTATTSKDHEAGF